MTAKSKTPATTFAELAIGAIRPHPSNVRRSNGTPAEMEEMAASIREAGIIEPLIVAAPAGAKGRRTDWRYTLIAGHRRLIGAVDAGLEAVPCVIRHDLDTEAKQREVMLIENDHRRGLSVTEQADGYQALMTFPGYTPTVIGRKLGRTRAFVEGRLSLAALPTRAREGVDHGQISITDALELAAFQDPETVTALAQYVGTRDWAWQLNQAKGDLDRAQHPEEYGKPQEPKSEEPDDSAGGAETPQGNNQPHAEVPADRKDHDPTDARTAREQLLRTLDTAARVRHEHLAGVITAGNPDTALAIARARVATAAEAFRYYPEAVGRVLGPNRDKTIKTMTLPQAVIALDALNGLDRDADLTRSASPWRQSHTKGWRQTLTDRFGYQWTPAEQELLGGED